MKFPSSRAALFSLTLLLTTFATLPLQSARAVAGGQNPSATIDAPSALDVTREFVLPEALVPVGGVPTVEQNRAALRALRTWRTKSSDYTPLKRFVAENSDSPWAPAILTDLGLLQYRDGYLLRALDCYEKAWSLGQNDQSVQGRALVDRAVGELGALLARLGKYDRLTQLLKEIGDRELTGAATELIAGARHGLHMMNHRPSVAFRCGPLAVCQILRHSGIESPNIAAIERSVSTRNGTSLAQVDDLAREVGLKLQPAFRTAGAPVLFPSVMHWKAGHFAALMKNEAGRYLVQDATFKEPLWITPEAVEEEASGYFMVPSGPLPAGWRAVERTEAETVWGRGQVNSLDPYATKTSDMTAREPGDPCGMAIYNFHALLASLTIRDTPYRYIAPVGPDVPVQITYNQREATQTTNVAWTSFGPKTACNWVGYVREELAQAPGSRGLVLAGGGEEFHYGFTDGDVSQPNEFSQATLERVRKADGSTEKYVRYLPDGSIEEYAFPIGTGDPLTLFFLTAIKDPQGNAVTITLEPQSYTTVVPPGQMFGTTYVTSCHIRSVQDANQNGAGFIYESDYAGPWPVGYEPSPFRPFFAGASRYVYDSDGRLQTIIDAVNINSQFQYEGSSDFVNSLTTPYGKTTFAKTEVDPDGPGSVRSISATDLDGNTEFLEFRDADGQAIPIPAGVTTTESPTPSGVLIRNQGAPYPTGQTLQYRNSFYFSKKACQTNPLDYTQAHVFHWLHSADFNSAVGVLESEKRPLERRVWYNYQGQHDAQLIDGTIVLGSGPTLFNGTSLVSKAGRVVDKVLDDGTVQDETQLFQWEYNDLGHVTKATDPAGRVFQFTYYSNNIDLDEVRNIRNGQNVRLLKCQNYVNHRPQLITDASGYQTQIQYNGFGQVLKVTNAKNEVTDYVYDSIGFLTDIKVGGQTVASYTPEATTHRVATETDGAGYTVSFTYDALNRVTKVTHPDGTFEQTIYRYLDPEWGRDRAGRWTQTLFDYARRPERIVDPLQQTTILNWCGCGELESIVDAEGRTTEFDYDIGGRLKKKKFPNGQELNFAYETGSSRLKQRTDARGQVANYRYYVDDQLQGIKYSNAQSATSDVGFVYDPDYGWITNRTDGLGTTSYTYNPFPAVGGIQLGAGQVSGWSAPRGGGVVDTVSLTYDELGRPKIITAAGVTRGIGYDVLGRVSSELNPLGGFTTEFLQNSGLKDQVKRGSDVWLDYNWQTPAQGRRLSQIKNRVPTAGGATISQFDYTYDAVGNVTGWQMQRDGSLVDALTLAYDPADQLLRSVRAGPGGSILSEASYKYDRAGHRTQEQRGLELGSLNDTSNVNQWSRSGGGQLRVWGQIDEPGTVKIDGQPVPVDGQNRFEGFLSVAAAGPKTFSIQAWDLNNNASAVKNYTVNVTVPSSATYGLDANGNVTTVSNGGPAYTWDAEDRLVKITQGTTESSFQYDGLGRLIRAIEKQNGTQVSDQSWLWLGTDRVAEFANNATTPSKRFYPQGIEIVGSPSQLYLYGIDHLGSTRELYTPTGTVVARYDYDAYGRQSVVGSETVPADFGFTGHWRHAPVGQASLWMAPLRAYDPEVGRWLSRDPQGEAGGLHLHGYVGNNPTTKYDPLGLSPCDNEPLIGFVLQEGEYYDVNDGSIRNARGEMIRDRYGRGFRENLRGKGNGSASEDEDIWLVGRHGDMPSPRPKGTESHHGVNSVWMEANVAGYRANDAPAILLRNDPFHNATRGVFNQFRKEIAARQGVSRLKIDWSKVSPGTAWRLAEEQLEAAQVPLDIREMYFQKFNEYMDSLKGK